MRNLTTAAQLTQSHVCDKYYAQYIDSQVTMSDLCLSFIGLSFREAGRLKELVQSVYPPRGGHEVTELLTEDVVTMTHGLSGFPPNPFLPTIWESVFYKQ